MSHPIIEGRVKLLRVVTPGSYWISCAACDGNCRVPSSIKRKPHPNEFYYPPQGAKVFARDEDGFFYRGTICGRRSAPLPSCWKYVVQLADTFQVKDFEQEDVYPSYNETNASCESAHLVSLYHLLPKMPPISYGKSVKVRNNDQFSDFENSVKNWDNSLARITDLFESRNFSFVQSKVISGSVYGELSFSHPLGDGNVVEYLAYRKVGVKLTYRFDEVVDALMVNSLVDPSTLLPTFNPLNIRASGHLTTPRPPSCPVQQPEPDEPEPESVDFTGFKVHEADSPLHQSLWTSSSVNIIFNNAPLDHETIIRFVSPDGEIVLGSVLNVDVKVSEQIDRNLDELLPRRRIRHYPKEDEYTEPHVPASLFERLPPDVDTNVEPRKSPFSYDLEASRQNFLTRGGIFMVPDLPSTSSPDAEELVGKYFGSLQVTSFHEWQKLCFPTLFRKGNLFVMGYQPMAKLTTSTIFALSWMTLSEDHSNSICPILIIFVADFNRADKMARLCKRLTDFKVIISNSSYITGKQKELALNGCDVLITSPGNWTELVSNNIFDYQRLSYVIFDEFSKLYELYYTDTSQVFENIKLSNRSIQTIIISSGYSEVIPVHLAKLESITVCIPDALLSNLFLGLSPNVVFVGCNDWLTVLENVVNEKRARKRLLLCKNELEGRSISDQICGEVMFIHENQQADTSSRIADEWRVKPAKLLVCTDDCFELTGVKDVDVLISWKSSSLANLSSRFMAFSAVPENKRKLTSAYIFCDCEKLDELLTVKGISKNVRFVNGSLDEHLITAANIVERCKLGPVCPSVFMFGKCSDVPACSQRHSFTREDDPESFSSSHFLKVDILRVHSAFRYSVRVHEIISNLPRNAGTLSSLTSNLKKIEAGLEKSSKNSPPPRLEIGQMVGAEILLEQGDCVLRRVSVKCLPSEGSGLYTLRLVDFDEQDVHLPLSMLFILSDQIAHLPKDVVELYITGMIPVDFKSDWQNDTSAYVTNARSVFFRDSHFLAGKVELITARTVLVDSLHCFEVDGSGQYVVKSLDHHSYSSMKDLILQSNYCVENLDHLSSLSSLLVQSGQSPLVNDGGGLGCRTDLPMSRVPGVVSHFQDPGRFCVQLGDESEKLYCMEKLISSALCRSKQRLFLVALHELCVVWNSDEEWNRAIVKDIVFDPVKSRVSVQVVFVDYGDARLVRPHELYRLPSEFGELPFFAIESELVGILPYGDLWEEEATSYFESLVRDADDVMKDLLINFCGIHRSGHHWRHRVVLTDPHCPENVSLNFDMARKGLAAFDPDSKHLIAAKSRKKISGIVTADIQV